MEKKTILEVLNSGFKYPSGDEQLKGIIIGIQLYYEEVQNKAEFLINLRDFVEQDIEQEFIGENTTEDYINNKFNSIESQEEKLSFCEMLEEIAFDLKNNLDDSKNCPNCDTKLEYKMFDVDGTNLEEFLTCTNCEYRAEK